MNYPRARSFALAFSFLGVVACKKDATEATPPTPATDAAPSASTVASTITTAKASGAPSTGKAPAPLDAKQRAQLAAYQKGMGEGRKATKAAKYKEAHDAFTAALAAKPGDARALGERGYAAFLAKDYDQANEDLYQAATGADDPALRAQIFYNLGLVREAEGLEATSAFALSNHLHASSAAQKKLGGKPACLVDIDRKSEPNVKYTDWMAFYKAAVDVDPQAEGTKPPTSSDAAKKQLCATSKCDGAGPWTVSVGEWPHGQVFLVIDAKPGLSVAKVAESFSGRCTASASAEIVESKGGVVVVRAEEQMPEMIYMCFPEKGDGHVCSDKDGDEMQRQSACTDGTKSTSYSVFDVAKGTRTLRVTHDDGMDALAKPGERTQVTVDAKGFALKGPGCNETLPLVAPTK